MLVCVKEKERGKVKGVDVCKREGERQELRMLVCVREGERQGLRAWCLREKEIGKGC